MRTGAFILVFAVALGGAATAHAADARGRILVGTDAGVFHAQVRVFGDDLQLVNAIQPFQGFSGGVRVAAGDVNGDGVVDVIAGAGPGGGPHVKVFDGQNGAVLHDFFVNPTGFQGGVFVAAGDVTGDGRADIVTGAGAGPDAGPRVNVLLADGSVRGSFFAFDPGFTGGVTVATGDAGGDGIADIIVGAGPGGGPHVRIFDGQTLAVKHDFFAFGPNFLGGVTVATGRFAGLNALFVGAGAGDAPQVNVYDLADGRLLDSFLAFAPGFDGGVRLGFGHVKGRDTLLVGMASRGGTVGLFDVAGRGRIGEGAPTYFNPFGDGYMDGVFLAGNAAIPEPATWAQMILGFGLIGYARRRRVAGAPTLG